MNFTGRDTKAFKANQTLHAPYYYIVARLDLKGLESNDVYYFNKENNLNYLDTFKTPYADEYGKYYTIDEYSTIGEVVVFMNPELNYTGNVNDLSFAIGGVYKPSVTLTTDNSIDMWGGITGNQPTVISINQLQNTQICYYGSSPEFPEKDPVKGRRKYLAIKITDSCHCVNNPFFTKGNICVVVKVYPKYTF